MHVYDYDAAGNCRVEMHRDGGRLTTVERTFTARNQVETESFSTAGMASSRTVSYSYYPSGATESVTLPGGRKVHYGQDDFGSVGHARFLAATDPTDTDSPTGPGVSYRRSWAGRPLEMARTNGVDRHFGYDGAGRLVAAGDFKPDGATGHRALLGLETAYKPSGNRLFEKRFFAQADGTVAADACEADLYRYDTLYRVTGAKYGCPAEPSGFAPPADQGPGDHDLPSAVTLLPSAKSYTDPDTGKSLGTGFSWRGGRDKTDGSRGNVTPRARGRALLHSVGWERDRWTCGGPPLPRRGEPDKIDGSRRSVTPRARIRAPRHDGWAGETVRASPVPFVAANGCSGVGRSVRLVTGLRARILSASYLPD